jgi:hypothetical protein
LCVNLFLSDVIEYHCIHSIVVWFGAAGHDKIPLHWIEVSKETCLRNC